MSNRQLRRFLAGVGLAAGTALAFAPGAQAQVLGANLAVYASQGVAASGGAITIPGSIGGGLGALSYTSAAFTTTGVGPACGNALITFNLPAGVTFTTVPGLTSGGVFGTGGCPASSIANSPVGSGTLVVSVNFPNTGAAGVVGSVTLQAFQVAGATALSTAAFKGGVACGAGGCAGFPGPTALTYTATASAATPIAACPGGGNPLALCQGAGLPVPAIFASSVSQLSIGYTAFGLAPAINVPAPGNAQAFTEIGEANGPLADVGTLTIATNAALDPTATVVFNFGGVTTGTVTLAGNFGGISGVFVTGNPATPCPATQPGGATAPSGAAAAVPGVSIGPAPSFPSVATHEVCIYAAGTGIISPSGGAGAPAVPFVAPGVFAAGFATTYTLAGTVASVGATAASVLVGTANVSAGYTYNGQVAQILYTQDASTVTPGFIRIVNGTLGVANVRALVRGDQGGPGSFGVAAVEGALDGTGGLAPQSNDTVPVDTIVKRAGITPGPFGRVSLILLSNAAPFTGLQFENLSYSVPQNILTFVP